MIPRCYCFQTTWALTQLFKAEYKYISVTSINDKATDGKSLNLYLKSVQENSVYKEPCVLKEK